MREKQIIFDLAKLGRFDDSDSDDDMLDGESIESSMMTRKGSDLIIRRWLYVVHFFSRRLCSRIHEQFIFKTCSQSQRQALDPLGRLFNTLIDLVRVGALSDGSRRARLASGLATNDGRHGTSPLGTVAALGLEGLCMC